MNEDILDGWSEMCALEDKEGCKKCDQYEKCYSL